MLLVAIPLIFLFLIILYTSKGLIPMPVALISLVLMIFFTIYIIRKQQRNMDLEDSLSEECDNYV